MKLDIVIVVVYVFVNNVIFQMDVHNVKIIILKKIGIIHVLIVKKCLVMDVCFVKILMDVVNVKMGIKEYMINFVNYGNVNKIIRFLYLF